MKKTCLQCTAFLHCSDPSKGRSHTCKSWSLQVGGPVKAAPNVDEIEELSGADGELETFAAAMDRMAAADTVIVADPRLDDRDIPLAANWAQWLMDREFLNVVPFEKQLEFGLRLFAEVCPDCSPEFWEADPIDGYSHKMRPDDLMARIEVYEHGKCPNCGGLKYRAIRDKKIYDRTGLVCVAGQRASKSILTTQLGSYVLHRYLKLRSPSQYFGLLRGTVLHGTFTANTFAQAKAALMDPFHTLLTDAPWFQTYHAWLADRGVAMGEELFKVRETFVVYRPAALHITVASPNKRNLRGATRFLTAIDELGWFSADEDKVKASGIETHQALARSLQTLRSAARHMRKTSKRNVPFPVALEISSPSDVNDPIMTLFRKYEHSKTYLTLHAPTWKINPTITKTDLKEFFDADYEKARRDFGAVPPMSANAFVPSIDLFKPVIDKRFKPAFTVKPHRTKNKVGHTGTSARLSWKWADPDGCGRLLALDVGLSDNSFAFCVCHMEDETLVFDAFGEIIPSKRHPVDLSDVASKVLKPICEKLNVIAAAADSWQSKKLLSDMEDEGIFGFTEKLKYDAFTSWREDGLLGTTFRIPRPEMSLAEIKDVRDDYRKAFEGKPTAHLIYQAITVVDRMKSVEKGDRLTDDLFRAMVLAHHLVMSNPDLAQAISGQAEREVEGAIISIGGTGTAALPEGFASRIGGVAAATPSNTISVGGSNPLPVKDDGDSS